MMTPQLDQRPTTPVLWAIFSMEQALAVVKLMESGQEIHPLVNVSSLFCVQVTINR